MDGNDHIDQQAIRDDLDEATENGKRLAPIDKQFGDGLPYQRDRIINEARWFMVEAAQSALEVGRRLILLKEHEARGEFEAAVEQIGIAPRAAQKLMQSAVKFSKAPQIANLGKAKMLELLTEDDDDIEALADGGTLAGHTLDEIDRMTRRELREALRKAKEQASQSDETHERMLADKNAKIDQLDKQLHQARDTSRPWPSRCFEVSSATTTHAAAALESMDRLEALREAILTERFDDDDREAAIESMAVVYYDAIRQLFDRAEELASACEEVFVGYKDKARPMLDVAAFRGEADDAAGQGTIQ